MRVRKFILPMSIVLFLAAVVGCARCDDPRRTVAVPEKDKLSVTPFKLLDSYLSYLSERDRDEFWSSVKQKGFQETLRDLEVPGSLYYTVGGSYINTVKGPVDADKYYETYVREVWEIVAKLRKISGNPFKSDSFFVPSQK